jgi:pimeloyl-ACP methyl ester carboxylesterase
MPLAYERGGTGPTLVLLHGLGQSARAWDPVLGRLTATRDVITVDLPGHGQSPPVPPDRYPALAQLTDQVADLLDELGLARPHLAGTSMGGRICLELALRGRAASATALSPAGFWHAAGFRYARAVLLGARWLGRAVRPAAPVLVRTRVLRTGLYGLFYGRPWRLTPDQAVMMLNTLITTQRFDEALNRSLTYDHAAPPSVPVTIAWGTRDLLLPRQARRARLLLPDAVHRALPGCGHLPMNDDPASVAAVLLAGSEATPDSRRG